MTAHVGVSGAYKTVAAQYVGVGGAWKTVATEYVGVGGAWKLAFAAVNLQGLDPYDAQISPNDASATYTLTNTGLEQATGLADGTWLTAGSASSYEVRATLVSGSLTSGTTGSWLSLASSHSWNVTRTLNLGGTTEAVLTIEIRLGAAVVATATVTISAEVV